MKPDKSNSSLLPATCDTCHLDCFTRPRLSILWLPKTRQSLLAEILEWSECKGVRFKRKSIFTLGIYGSVSVVPATPVLLHKSGMKVCFKSKPKRSNCRPHFFQNVGLLRESCEFFQKHMALGLVNGPSNGGFPERGWRLSDRFRTVATFDCTDDCGVAW